MDIKILDYAPHLAIHFERLNKEWLIKYFNIEPVDQRIFDDPEAEIIRKPGFILFAESKGEVVGTGAIIKSDCKWELIKMAVNDQYQSQGVGRIIASRLIEKAQSQGAQKIFIVTNTKLDKAIGLYLSLGFRIIHRGSHPKYQRGNLLMELTIIASLME